MYVDIDGEIYSIGCADRRGNRIRSTVRCEPCARGEFVRVVECEQRRAPVINLRMRAVTDNKVQVVPRESRLRRLIDYVDHFPIENS